MPHPCNAKIVATLGPASADRATIEALVRAGADVFRLNFSHGTHADHRQRLETIRAIEADLGRPIGVLLDLQGPKLRVGTFDGGRVELAEGAAFRLDLDRSRPGDATRAPLPRPEIFAALRPGAGIVAKLEKPAAIDCLDEILAETDAVMLSAESASGRFPVEAVAMMDRIIARTEADPQYRDAIDASHTQPPANVADAIGWAARSVAGLLDVAAMVAYTSSGASALRMARERPRAPIIGITPRPATARRLTLVWGVNPVVGDDVDSVDAMTRIALQTAAELHFAAPGQTLVIAAGMPFGSSGTTNLLRIAQLD